MTAKRVLISADHGLAIVYFLQTEVVPRLLQAGVEVKLLTEDGLVGRVRERFGEPALSVEGLRLDRGQRFADSPQPALQWWAGLLRRGGGAGGWRRDRYLRREARAAGLRTASVVVGWDNPSSYSIPGARVDDMICWSSVQRQELELGSDWPPGRGAIRGIPV